MLYAVPRCRPAALATSLAFTPRALALHGALPGLDEMDVQEPQTLELAAAALKRDPRQTKELVAACHDGSQDACLVLGTDYELGKGVERSDWRALELYRNACTQGLQLACVLEGSLTMRDPVVKDGRGRRQLEATCAAGESLGCYALGLAAWEGIGEPKSAQRAGLIWRRACAAAW